MKKSKPISFFRWAVICLLVVSCGEKTSRYAGFTETVDLTSRKHDFDGVYMKFPYRVRVSQSTLYVTDLHPEEYFCHTFDYPSMKYIKSFARRGKGPEEITDVGNIIVADGTVYMLDAFGRKIYTYDGDRINLFAELPEELIRCMDFTLYNDSVFIVPDYSGKQRLIFVDRKGEIIRRTGSIPGKDEKSNIPETALGQAWRPFIAYNPRNGISALANQFGEVLEIYDLRTDHVIVKIGPGGEPKFRMKGANVSMDGIRGYSDAFVGEQYIYALFWGYEMEKVRSGEITTDGGDLIQVFDLKGNPVRQYRLDCLITGFHVDETNGVIIGTDVNEEQLVTFDFKP